MNFLYYKNFENERSVSYSSSSSGYKKKKNSKKGGYRDDNTGHSESCECDVCSSQFPLRTHLMLNMSLAKFGEGGLGGGLRKSNAGGGPPVNFSIFGRSRKPLLTKEERKPAASRVTLNLLPDGTPSPMPAPQPSQANVGVTGPSPAVPHEPVTLGTLKQDCIMVPIERMSHFYPAGHPIPTQVEQGNRVRMLETVNPHLKILFHLITPCQSLMPMVQSPLFDAYKHQKECVVKAFKTASSSVNYPQLQGMVLMNLERECEEGRVEFSFMIVWIIDELTCGDITGISRKLRLIAIEHMDPTKTGFTCSHFFDIYDEVVTLARPPIEKLSRKATSASTGYIISVFRVFEGDDGQKFERNWLTWTGAKTLYKSLSPECDLRRFTLHKSSPQKGVFHYILMCDVSNFLSHLGTTVKAVPILRMRLCGDVGLYRPIASL